MIKDGLQLVSDNPQVKFKKVENTYVLSIADDAVIKKPINLQILIGKNSKATIIERFECKSDQQIELNQTINADIGSDLRIITMQNLNSKSKFTENRITNAKKSAKIHCFDFQMGGKTSNLNIQQNADEESDINSDILCNAKNNQQFNFNVSNIYCNKNGRGKILIKSSAEDKSFVIINGGISIKKKGGGTDAHLKQDSLLLSENASIKAIPKLNVDTDNVKAGHGASITNLNKESLFYLTSRGISEADARKMMINGFMSEVLDKVKDLSDIKL